LSRSDDLRIADVLEAAEQLETLVADGRRASTGTGCDSGRRSACSRSSVRPSNAISDEFKAENADVPWRHVVNLRHLLAHHYHRVDIDQIWTIATINVPAMAEQLADAAE